ncbi:MAG: S1 RNA-binding domain-containing protein [Bacillota bacterium]
MSAVSELEIGTVVEGTVSGITSFGAFIALPNGKTGLVHISEVADEYVRDVRDYLKEQDVVRVKILTLDDRGRIALSIKQADPNYRRDLPKPRRSAQSFEDKLSKFLKESEDRMMDLRRLEGKRGGRGGRSN